MKHFYCRRWRRRRRGRCHSARENSSKSNFQWKINKSTCNFSINQANRNREGVGDIYELRNSWFRNFRYKKRKVRSTVRAPAILKVKRKWIRKKERTKMEKKNTRFATKPFIQNFVFRRFALSSNFNGFQWKKKKMRKNRNSQADTKKSKSNRNQYFEISYWTMMCAKAATKNRAHDPTYIYYIVHTRHAYIHRIAQKANGQSCNIHFVFISIFLSVPYQYVHNFLSTKKNNWKSEKSNIEDDGDGDDEYKKKLQPKWKKAIAHFSSSIVSVGSFCFFFLLKNKIKSKIRTHTANNAH